jgi:hypothetical protein
VNFLRRTSRSGLGDPRYQEEIATGYLHGRSYRDAACNIAIFHGVSGSPTAPVIFEPWRDNRQPAARGPRGFVSPAGGPRRCCARSSPSGLCRAGQLYYRVVLAQASDREHPDNRALGLLHVADDGAFLRSAALVSAPSG